MKEIEVHAFCDGHHPWGGRVEAVIEVRMAINGSKFKVLDLCASHDLELAALFERAGTVPDAEPKAAGRKPMPGPHLCPICNSDHASRNAMTKHLRAAHGTSIKEIAERAQA